jgi:hypothetical protein
MGAEARETLFGPTELGVNDSQGLLAFALSDDLVKEELLEAFA